MKSGKFHEVIRKICGRRVLPLNPQDTKDAALLEAVRQVAVNVCGHLKNEPIVSARANEVGNRIEPHVRDFFNRLPGYEASVPLGKASGYPDILLEDASGRHAYVECKTYNSESLESAFRSFYFSASENFKVIYDAPHLVVGFEIVQVSEGRFRPVGFKMVDAHSLQCTLKEEWNSSNKLLYSLPILAQYRE